MVGTCYNCLWCRQNLIGKKKYKCGLMPKSRRFNFPKLHGILCACYHTTTEELRRLKIEQEVRRNAEH